MTRGAHTELTAPTHLPADCDLGGKSFSAGVRGPALLPGSTKLSGLRRPERIHSGTASSGQHFGRIGGFRGRLCLLGLCSCGVDPGAAICLASLSLDPHREPQDHCGLSCRRIVKIWKTKSHTQEVPQAAKFLPSKPHTHHT